MRIAEQRIGTVQREVLGWFARHQRDLPWRRTTDPYNILVSESMLQQTQVNRVIPKYHECLTRFPTVNDLAAATPADVITAWRGLGYNRRALYLHRAAKIVSNLGGWIPDPGWLRSLPGVGRYTAGAIMNFAFGIDTPAVDTNVKQFIDHFVPTHPLPTLSVGMPESVVSRKEREYYEIAEKLMPKGKARTWLHAVMDYSALVLRPHFRASTRGVEQGRWKKREAFAGSNRYLRGRTIDRLREAPQTLDELFARIAAPIDVDRTRYEALVASLEREGFIHARGRALALVE